jgi:hypothetical protein
MTGVRSFAGYAIRTGGSRIDRHLPARTEVVHASERTRVTRLLLAGCTVIRKEPLGEDAQRRLQHELAMLERLRGAAGIAQLADAPLDPGSILLVDVGGTSLVNVPKPLPSMTCSGWLWTWPERSPRCTAGA